MAKTQISAAAKKANADQAAAADVLAWLVDGQRENDIREALAVEHPSANPENVLNAAAEHFLQAGQQCNRAVLVGWALEAYRDLYRQAKAQGDFAVAMRAIRELLALAPDTEAEAEEPA